MPIHNIMIVLRKIVRYNYYHNYINAGKIMMRTAPLLYTSIITNNIFNYNNNNNKNYIFTLSFHWMIGSALLLLIDHSLPDIPLTFLKLWYEQLSNHSTLYYMTC